MCPARLALRLEPRKAKTQDVSQRGQTIIEAECDRRKIQRSALIGFLKAVKSTKAPIADFTPQLWNALVEKGHCKR